MRNKFIDNSTYAYEHINYKDLIYSSIIIIVSIHSMTILSRTNNNVVQTFKQYNEV